MVAEKDFHCSQFNSSASWLGMSQDSLFCLPLKNQRLVKAVKQAAPCSTKCFKSLREFLAPKLAGKRFFMFGNRKVFSFPFKLAMTLGSLCSVGHRPSGMVWHISSGQHFAISRLLEALLLILFLRLRALKTELI